MTKRSPDEERGSEDRLYDPPEGAEQTDRLDASVDGTSASHYGTNDPELSDRPDRSEG